MLNVNDEIIKIYNLMLKYIFITYSIDDLKTMYTSRTTKESDLLLLYAIHDMLEKEPAFFSLSSEVTQKIEDVFQILRWKVKDVEMTPTVNESIILFNEIYNQPLLQKKEQQRIYLKENFKMRARTGNYYEELLENLDESLDSLIRINLDFQRYDYSFFLQAKNKNFEYMLSKKHYFPFLFSLNYLMDYDMPELFTSDRKDLYKKILKQMVQTDKNTKTYVKRTKKHLRQI